MPMDTTKYTHKHHPFIKHISLYTSGQDIDPFYFPKYRLPYIWTRYIFFLISQNTASILVKQGITYSSEVHDKGDPFSKLLE